MPIAVTLIGTRGVTTSGTLSTIAGTSVGGSGSHGLFLTSYDPGVTITSIGPDSKGNTFTLRGTVLTNFGRQAAYVSENWTGGASHNIGATFSGNAFAVGHLLEITGAASASPIDKDVNNVDTARPVTINSGTLAQAAEAVIVFCEDNDLAGTVDYTDATAALTVLSSEPDVGTYWTSGVAYKIVSATTDTAYQLQRQAAGSSSSLIRLISFKEAAGGDTTAPTLTSPTGAATGATTATGTVSTDEANGTAWAVVTTSATAPSAAQVQAGQDHTGAAAAWGGSQSITSTGTKTFNATGLAPSTTYWFHFQHRDAASNNSTVVSSASFATSAATPNITGSSSANPQRGAAHTVTGSSFGATQGTKQLRLGGVVQTPTSWADGSITYTLAADLLKSGVAVNVEIWETSPSASLLSNSFALTSIQPQAGWSFVDVGTPNTTAANRLTFAADAASGDQVEWFTNSGMFAVNTDLTFTATGYGTFGARLWTPGDGFGAAADQVVTPFNVLGSGRVARHALGTSPLGVGPLLTRGAEPSTAGPAATTSTASRAGARSTAAATKATGTNASSRAGARADAAGTKAASTGTSARAGARATAVGAKGAAHATAGRAGVRADDTAAKAATTATAARVGARADATAVAAIGRSTSTAARAGVRADATGTKAASTATAARAGARADLAAAKAAALATAGRVGVRSSVTAVAGIGITTSTAARVGVRADAAGTKAAATATAARAGARADLAAAKAAALATSGRAGVRGSAAGVPVSGISTSTGSRAGARASVTAVRGAVATTGSQAGVRGACAALKAAQAVTLARAGVMGANAARKAASTSTASRVGVRCDMGGAQLLPLAQTRIYKLPPENRTWLVPPVNTTLTID